MDANELRALADALLPMAAAPCFDGIDVERAADYLRAQADAKPVAWLYRDWANVLKVSQLDPHEDGAFAVFAEPQPQAETQPVPAGWKWVPVEPTQAMNNAGLSAVNQYGKRSVWETYAAMLAAAPAAPQAEPKREPLPGLTPTHRCPACGAFWRQCDDNSWNLRSASCCGLCDAGRVELVRWLDEPKREPLTALLELAEQSDDCQRGTLSTSIVRELVIEALGIGGSDD